MSNPALTTLLRSVAGNVRRLRIGRDLSQAKLAELVGVDVTYLQRAERATQNLSMKVLVGLATALHVAPAALLRKAQLPLGTPGRPRKRAKKTAR